MKRRTELKKVGSLVVATSGGSSACCGCGGRDKAGHKKGNQRKRKASCAARCSHHSRNIS